MSSSESDEFEVIDQLEASLSAEELAKVQAWLQPTDYGAQSSEFHRHLSSQAPGTGLWICETSKYQQWLESNDHGSLWIKGVPGAGKSVTAASMIQYLQKTKDTPVLYFFFRYIISANRRPRSLVRDFLAQLLPYSSRLQATLQPLIGSPLDDFSDERLWEHLLTGLSSIEKAYCVVDALDEMELLPKDGFLNRLNSLATFRPNSVKLLMTSRPKQYLQSSLRDASIVHISLEDELVGKDIGVFLSYRLKTLLPHDDQQKFRESLVSAISERSDGLFLYARLLLDQIIPSLESTQLDVDRLVKDLPVGLEEMYNSMLSQQARSLKIDVQIQVLLLELATHSSRALRLNEMASALAATFPASMLPDIPKVVARSACAPLLEILEDETVSVIHHSFTEFLLNSERIGGGIKGNALQFPALNPDIVHKKLSVICMDYLRSGGLRADKDDVQSRAGKDSVNDRKGLILFDTPEKEDDGYNYQEAKLRYPYLEYAVGGWAFHASKYDFEDHDFFKSISDFLDPDSIDFKKWLELEWMKDLKFSEIQAPTPLHVAAFAGLTEYAKKLLKEDASVDAPDVEDRMPLHWACARGHAAMVSLLLKGGATPDPEDTRGVKPIHEAARKNHSGIVKMLLEAGVDPLTPKTEENIKRRLICGEVSTVGETAVEYVWLQGHTDTIITMLPFLTPETLEELFCQCCRYGKFEAVRAILKATNLSPNSKSSGATALYLACRAQSVALVELLVAKGADVNQPSEWKVTNRNSCGSRVREEPLRLPIHGVVMGWRSANNLACQQILRLLINAGANIEAKDADGDTPLLSLFSNRHSHSHDADSVAVRGLLQAGANVLVVDDHGESVLHRCLQKSVNTEVLKLLFEFEARADVIGKDGNTVLHTALYRHRRWESQCMADVVNLLLEKGARCDVKNNDGCTAIEDAACSQDCSLETFTVLVQSCSDTDTLQRCMWKLAREEKDENVGFIRLLQSFGVSLEHRDSNGATVLLTRTGIEELFAALLECGANLDAVDSEGRGALHHFISASHYGSPHECLRRLGDMVDMKLDPMKVSLSNPLQLCSIPQFSANKTQVDQYGNNVLHLVAKSYTGKELDDLFVRKLLEYGLSVNSKNKQGMTPLHVHLENWDVNSWTNSVHKSLDERFHELHQIPLLSLFRKYVFTLTSRILPLEFKYCPLVCAYI
jgi:ankyrin repeat protein